jgi:hypothetical protein
MSTVVPAGILNGQLCLAYSPEPMYDEDIEARGGVGRRGMEVVLESQKLSIASKKPVHPRDTLEAERDIVFRMTYSVACQIAPNLQCLIEDRESPPQVSLRPVTLGTKAESRC